MKIKKVGIVGVGNVGSTLAYTLATKQICDEIILNDINENLLKATSLDISQAIDTVTSKVSVKAVNKTKELKNCDVIVITAGIARKPGMNRDDLLNINSKIMQDVIKDIIEFNKQAIIIIVSNPLDLMVYTALKASNFPRERIIGMAGILDSSRMSSFILDELEDKNVNIKSLVIGGHGNEMLPLINHSTINNKPLSSYLNSQQIENVIKKTKNAGANIVELLKNGSAYYAPANATALMINAILNDTKEILPSAVLLKGEYAYENIVTGVPIKLGKNGCEDIIYIKLNTEEQKEFDISVNSFIKQIKSLEK